MRVTYHQLIKLLETLPKNEWKGYLNLVFSFSENIDTYAYFIFDTEISTELAKFHYDLLDFLKDSSNGAIAAPRGSGKSTIAGLVFTSWSIVNKKESYIVYVSQNHAKTVQFITPLRDCFRNNERLHFVYGDLTPQNTKDDEGRDREDCIDINGIRIEAVSFEKNLRGFKFKSFRPSLIIGDDIEEDERVMNPEIRKKDEDKLNKVIIPALSVNGRFKMIGTILHGQSLLMKKILLHSGKIFRAIKEDGTSLIPQMYSLEKLDQIKKEIGTLAFQQEYMNDPRDNETAIIKKEWILKCFYSEYSSDDLRKLEFKRIYGGVDFAFSDRVTADKSAFVSLGETMQNKYALIFCQTKKGLSIMEQISYIKDYWNSVVKHNKIGVEENSIKSVSKDYRSFGFPVKLFWLSASDSKNKTPDPDRLTIGKDNMINRIAVAFENNKLIIPYKTDEDKVMAEQLMEELCSFSNSDGKLVESGIHADIPIALGYCLELMEGLRFAVPTVGRANVF
jgi:hypothetical protein